MIEIPAELLKSICHHLGTNSDDPEESDYVASLIRSALADLYDKTGVNWLECTTDNYDKALEVVRSKVYLSYYGNRDDAKNTAHLEKFIASKTFSLMYSEEAQAAMEAHHGSQA